jgi:hypothetical protein
MVYRFSAEGWGATKLDCAPYLYMQAGRRNRPLSEQLATVSRSLSAVERSAPGSRLPNAARPIEADDTKESFVMTRIPVAVESRADAKRFVFGGITRGSVVDVAIEKGPGSGRRPPWTLRSPHLLRPENHARQDAHPHSRRPSSDAPIRSASTTRVSTHSRACRTTGMPSVLCYLYASRARSRA